MCECNKQASLKVSKSASNQGKPFFACRNNGEVYEEKRATTKISQRIWEVLKKKQSFFFFM